MALSAKEKKNALKVAKEEAGMKNPAFIEVDEAYLAANPDAKNPAGESIQLGDEIIIDLPGKPGKTAVTKVVFTRKDGSTRTFTEEIHGEDFVAVADEFAKTNEKFIADRKDL